MSSVHRSELENWPRPSVAVDVALLTVVPGESPGRLSVLLHRRAVGYGEGRWSLPGTFVHEGERLAQSALRALKDKVRVQGERPEQLGVFDDPGRDDRGWVLSVAHVDLIPYARLEPALTDACALAAVEGEIPAAVVDGHAGGLLFDHDEIVAKAVGWARDAYEQKPDPLGLLGEEFTLYELQRLHEAVLGGVLPKDRWRRSMESPERGLLESTGGYQRGSVGAPARLFRRGSG